LVSPSILLLFLSLEAAIPSDQAFGGSLGLSWQSTQQSRDKASGGGDEKDARALEAGKPIKSELAAGQRHFYRVEMKADQFLKVVIKQNGIDVVAEVAGPDGKTILEFDSESRTQGREEASFVAEVTGAFLLIVLPNRMEFPPEASEAPEAMRFRSRSCASRQTLTALCMTLAGRLRSLSICDIRTSITRRSRWLNAHWRSAKDSWVMNTVMSPTPSIR